jgi:hypothetical protein
MKKSILIALIAIFPFQLFSLSINEFIEKTVTYSSIVNSFEDQYKAIKDLIYKTWEYPPEEIFELTRKIWVVSNVYSNDLIGIEHKIRKATPKKVSKWKSDMNTDFNKYTEYLTENVTTDIGVAIHSMIYKVQEQLDEYYPTTDTIEMALIECQAIEIDELKKLIESYFVNMRWIIKNTLWKDIDYMEYLARISE